MLRRLVVAVVAAAFVVLVAPAAPAGARSVDEARSAARTAVAELAAVESDLGEIETRIRVAEQSAADAEAALDGLRVQVRGLAVARYMQFDQMAVVPGGDINAPERARVFVMVVAGHNFDLMDEYARQRTLLETSQAELELARQRQSGRLAELADRRAVVDAELARLELAELAAVATTTSTTTSITTSPTSSPVSPGVVAGPSTSMAPGPGTAPMPVPTPMPVPAPIPPPASGWLCPVQGTKSFVDSWMAPRPGGRSHQGVDLMSPRGTPVVLPVGGRTTFRTGGIGGLTFNLNGDDGNYYYGAHLDSYAGLADGWYAAGTVVGYVGDTGDAKGTGTHLHFEIHVGGYGNAVNPYPTTRANC